LLRRTHPISAPRRIDPWMTALLFEAAFLTFSVCARQ
jgi:hypothetical protein